MGRAEEIAIEIREAVRTDAPAVARLSAELAEVLRHAGNPISATLTREAILRDGFGNSPAFSVLVADVADQVVGYLLHHPSYDPDLGGRATTVVDLYVTEHFRRRGVGRALMEEAARLCQRNDGCALVWWVRSANRGAVAFYEELGASKSTDLLSMRLPVARAPRACS